MFAGRRNLERALGRELAAHLGEVRSVRLFQIRLREIRSTRARPLRPAFQGVAYLPQMAGEP